MSSTIDIDQLMDLMFGQPILFETAYPIRSFPMPELRELSRASLPRKRNLMSKSRIKMRRSAKSLKRWKKQKAQRQARKITARCGK